MSEQSRAPRLLVVANETLAGDELIEAVQRRAERRARSALS